MAKCIVDMMTSTLKDLDEQKRKAILSMKKKKIEVFVTEQDIRNGRRNNATGCPIALAVRRATGCKDVEVSSDVTIKGQMACSDEHVKRFVIAFDAKRKVKPIRLKLSMTELVDSLLVD